MSSVAATVRSSGMSVMSCSFCPVPGSRHCAHGQLSRSQTAGNRRRGPSMASSSSPSPPLATSRLPYSDALRRGKVGYTCSPMTIVVAVARTQRIVVVGGGVLGTMHAVAARRRGFEVVQLEREAEARGASVRNFGLVWVSGRQPGPELALAQRARELWEELGAQGPGLGCRAAGSLTLATEDAELGLLKEAAARPDAERRGFELLDPGGVRAVNPALRGEFAGGLLCRLDAVVEPRQVLPALRGYLAARAEGTSGYQWWPGREATEIAPNAVRDHTGSWHRGDLVIVCTGAAHTGVAGRHLARGGAGRVGLVRRVRLQM